MASLWLQVPEASVRSFFHDPTGNCLTMLYTYNVCYLLLVVARSYV